jgi:hypothetical protein
MTPNERTVSTPANSDERDERPSGLRLTILVPSQTVEHGSSVSVWLAIVNEGPRDLRITFSSSQKFDLIVKDMAGREVSRWSNGKSFLQVIQDVNLQQGNKIEGELVWEANVPPGTYNVVGLTPSVLVDGRAVTLESPPVVLQVQ